MRFTTFSAAGSLLLAGVMIGGCESVGSSGSESGAPAGYTISGSDRANLQSDESNTSGSGNPSASGAVGRTAAEAAGVGSGDNQPRP